MIFLKYSGSLPVLHLHSLTGNAGQLQRFSLHRLSKSVGRSEIETSASHFGVLKVCYYARDTQRWLKEMTAKVFVRKLHRTLLLREGINASKTGGVRVQKERRNAFRKRFSIFFDNLNVKWYPAPESRVLLGFLWEVKTGSWRLAVRKSVAQTFQGVDWTFYLIWVNIFLLTLIRVRWWWWSFARRSWSKRSSSVTLMRCSPT